MFIRSQEDGLVVINDIRSTSLQLVKSQVFHKWKSKSDGQEQFACDGMKDLPVGRIIMKHGSYQEQQTFVHVATNAIEYHRVVDPDDDSKTMLIQLECQNCQSNLTLTHLMTCPDQASLDLHHAILTSVLDGFAHLAECSHWLQYAKDHVHLHDLMTWLFPLPASSSDEERRDHSIRCAIGAITEAQYTNAIKRLGIRTKDAGLGAFITLRRVCLEHIGDFYTQLKLKT